MLIHGDCLEKLPGVLTGSIDMVLTDLPYGSTECAWDTTVPLHPLWGQLTRVTKSSCAMVFFGQELFSASLMLSNPYLFRYSLVWEKSKVARFAQAKQRFLNSHEDILVFSDGRCSSNAKLKMRYYPQGLEPFGKMVKDTSHKNGHRLGRKQLPDYFQEFTNYPKSVLRFNSVSKTVHPTQKPVELLEYLIKTYTLKGDTVLDPAMGSGSTGVACKNLGRKFIGIERDEKYFEIAKTRIAGHMPVETAAEEKK